MNDLKWTIFVEPGTTAPPTVISKKYTKWYEVDGCEVGANFFLAQTRVRCYSKKKLRLL